MFLKLELSFRDGWTCSYGIDCKKYFFVKFYHTSVYFCYLKCCTCIFGEPNNGCLCSRCRVANNLDHFYKVIGFLDRSLCYLINLVLVVFFRVVFSNRKTLFLGILYFLCLLCSLMGHLYQCVVSNVYRVGHRLIVRVRRYTGIFRLVLYVLGVFQVVIDVQSLKKLEN